MENETSMNPPLRASSYDEILMQQRLHFADGLKDLKNLRKQLYSAAEYFEVSYDKDDHKQFVVETSRDYVTKALISTVDHLGSVADKLGQILDEKTNELSATKLRFSCVEQRLKTCQGFIDLSGLSQQSLILAMPTHHKHYIIPEEVLPGGKPNSLYKNYISCPGDDLNKAKQDNVFGEAFKAATLKPNTKFSRKGHLMQPSTQSSLTFSFTRIESIKRGKRSVSPLRFAINRSGSITNRSSSLSSTSDKHRMQLQCPSQPRKVSIKPEINGGGELHQYTKRSKHLFKALLSIHRSRSETAPSKYSDER